MTTRLIYHICRENEWVVAEGSGIYAGSSQDHSDGFIHFSSGSQIVGSANKHRAGQDNLILLEVDEYKLGPSLKWEVSRNNEEFPHLYGELPVAAVTRSFKLKLDLNGKHLFPEDWGLT
jgi:uncharacterized protein (DUF952 family)